MAIIELDTKKDQTYYALFRAAILGGISERTNFFSEIEARRFIENCDTIARDIALRMRSKLNE